MVRSPDDAFLMYVVRVAPRLREDIRQHMADRGISTSVHYPSLARHALFRDDGNAGVHQREVDDTLVTLPTFLEMDTAEQGRVVDALEAALEATTGSAAPRAARA